MNRCMAKAGRLVLAALLASTTLLNVVSVYADDGEGKRGKNGGETEAERSFQEDHELEGQVLEINTLKSPPEMVLATIDGKSRVIMYKTDEIARNAVRLGDYITVIGEKQSEVLFEGNTMRVDAHLGQKKKN